MECSGKSFELCRKPAEVAPVRLEMKTFGGNEGVKALKEG